MARATCVLKRFERDRRGAGRRVRCRGSLCGVRSGAEGREQRAEIGDFGADGLGGNRFGGGDRGCGRGHGQPQQHDDGDGDEDHAAEEVAHRVEKQLERVVAFGDPASAAGAAPAHGVWSRKEFRRGDPEIGGEGGAGQVPSDPKAAVEQAALQGFERRHAAGENQQHEGVVGGRLAGGPGQGSFGVGEGRVGAQVAVVGELRGGDPVGAADQKPRLLLGGGAVQQRDAGSPSFGAQPVAGVGELPGEGVEPLGVGGGLRGERVALKAGGGGGVASGLVGRVLIGLGAATGGLLGRGSGRAAARRRGVPAAGPAGR